MEKSKKAYLFALLSVLCWSTVATAFKIALKSESYLNLLFFSSLTSLLFLFIVILWQGKLKEIISYNAKEYLISIFLGFLNPFLYYLILFKAYSILPAQTALTLNYTWAVMVVILSIPILKQKIKASSLLAIIISFVGVMVIATQGNPFELDLSEPYGVALALISSVIWALYWILNVKDKRDEIVKLFLNFFFGLIFILCFILPQEKITIETPESALALVYIGLFEMGLTFVLWLKALQLSKTTAQVSNLIYASPFLSLIFINFIIGEKILPSTIIGFVLVLIGIIIQKKKGDT